MINQQILDYIKQQRAAGTLPEEIKTKLKAQGWSDQDIAQAFAEVDAPTVSPTLPSVPFIFKIALSLVLGVFIVGATAYAYNAGTFSLILNRIPFLSHPPYQKDAVLSGVVIGLSKINTSSWDFHAHVFTQPRDKDATAFVATSTGAQQLLLNAYSSFIPTNFDTALDLNGATQKNSASTNARTSLSLNLTADDLSLSVAAEARKVGDNLYGIINKIPGLFGSLSAIKEHWVVITPEDQKMYGSLLGSLHTIDLSEKQTATQQKNLNDLKTLLTLEEQDNLLNADDPQRVTVNNTVLYEYNLTLNPSAIATFYRDAMKAFSNASSTYQSLFTQTELAYLESPEGKRFAEYLSENFTISIQADSTGVPHTFKVSLRIVPPSDLTKFANKQIRVEGSVTLNDVNHEVVIDAPSPTISLSEAYKLITGKNLSDAIKKSRDSRRVADLYTIRFAIESYHSKQGVYPDLTTFLAPQYILTLPLDPLDKATYLYKHTQSSFTLSADLEDATDAQRGVGTVSKQSCSGENNGRYCYTINSNSYNTSPALQSINSSDSLRKQDLYTFYVALQQYAAEHDQAYPSTLAELAGSYLSKGVPKDPVTGKDYLYRSTSDDASYGICALMSNQQYACLTPKYPQYINFPKQAIETSRTNWLTYTDPQNRYKISYPRTWSEVSVVGDMPDVGIAGGTRIYLPRSDFAGNAIITSSGTTQNTMQIEIHPYILPSTLSFTAYQQKVLQALRDDIASSNQTINIYSTQQTTIKGYPAFKISYVLSSSEKIPQPYTVNNSASITLIENKDNGGVWITTGLVPDVAFFPIMQPVIDSIVDSMTFPTASQ